MRAKGDGDRAEADDFHRAVYLLRSYEIDKKQPLVNLTLATAYLQRAMTRKTDNRQHQIAQVSFPHDAVRSAR